MDCSQEANPLFELYSLAQHYQKKPSQAPQGNTRSWVTNRYPSRGPNLYEPTPTRAEMYNWQNFNSSGNMRLPTVPARKQKGGSANELVHKKEAGLPVVTYILRERKCRDRIPIRAEISAVNGANYRACGTTSERACWNVSRQTHPAERGSDCTGTQY
jgi:hypothetical protein